MVAIKLLMDIWGIGDVWL